MVGAGIDHPRFDINRMILNELTVTGSFVYDLGGFERRSSCSPPTAPLRAPHRPRRYPAHRHRRHARGAGLGRIAARSWSSRHDASLLPLGNPRFNHVACRCRPTCSMPRTGPISAASSTSAGLHGNGSHDGGPASPHHELRALGPIHLPDRRGRPDAVSPHGSLRICCRLPRRVARRAGSCGAFLQSDDRMELIDLHVDDQKMVKIHSVYVRYLLPMTVSSSIGSSPSR